MAGRSPKPWYRANRKRWFVILNGERINLGPDKAEAFRRFHEIMAGGGHLSPPPAASDPPPTVTFAEVADKYLAHIRGRSASRAPVVTAHYLKPFRRAFGPRPAASLRAFDVEAAISAHGRWNPTSARLACSRLITALTWAVEVELIPGNPLAKMKKPPARTRGAEAVVDPDAVRRMIEAAPPFLADILTAMRDTGCRPGEVLRVTAADFDPSAGVWILAKHKTAGTTGRPRIVYLTPAVVAMCSRLAKIYPSGPLFRTLRGQPFRSGMYLPKLMAGLRKKLGLPRGVVAYSFRHTFITDALAGGVPDAHVAELAGHSGTAMIHRHYSHLGQKSRALKEALGRVRGSAS